MNKFKSFVLSLIFIFAISTVSATLTERGDRFVYDSDLDVTWIKDINYITTSGFTEILNNYNIHGLVTWNIATIWADQLVYGGYDDWRLPTKAEILLIDSSAFDLTLFSNVNYIGYWTSTQSGYGSEYKWYYVLPFGVTDIAPKKAARGAWVLRDGDTVSPNSIEFVEGGDFGLVEGGTLEWVEAA